MNPFRYIPCRHRIRRFPSSGRTRCGSTRWSVLLGSRSSGSLGTCLCNRLLGDLLYHIDNCVSKPRWVDGYSTPAQSRIVYCIILVSLSVIRWPPSIAIANCHTCVWPLCSIIGDIGKIVMILLWSVMRWYSAIRRWILCHCVFGKPIIIAN